MRLQVVPLVNYLVERYGFARDKALEIVTHYVARYMAGLNPHT